MRSGHSFDFGIGCAHEIWRGAGILMISRIPTVGTDEQTSSLRLLVSGGKCSEEPPSTGVYKSHITFGGTFQLALWVSIAPTAVFQDVPGDRERKARFRHRRQSLAGGRGSIRRFPAVHH